jgi:hypothetical protein
MTDKKAPNYTEAQAAELVAAYVEAGTETENQEARESVVTEFADRFGKNTKSIRQKLVREGVYIKKIATTKTGAKVETKEKIVAAIASTMGVNSEDLPGLESATKATLNLLRGTLTVARELIDNAEDNQS